MNAYNASNLYNSEWAPVPRGAAPNGSSYTLTQRQIRKQARALGTTVRALKFGKR